MSAVFAALVLVILGAFVQCSGAIRCYVCGSPHGEYCDPLDTGNDNVYNVTCPPTYNACWSGQGWAFSKKIRSFLLKCLIQTYRMLEFCFCRSHCYECSYFFA